MTESERLARQPTEYGGNAPGIEPRVTPNGRVAPKSIQEQARDMRRAGLREAHGQKPEPRR